MIHRYPSSLTLNNADVKSGETDQTEYKERGGGPDS